MFAKVHDEVEQVPAVLVIQRSSRFIQNQQTHLLRQRLGNLDELLLTDTDVRDAQGLDTPVPAGAQVVVLPSVAGG